MSSYIETKKDISRFPDGCVFSTADIVALSEQKDQIYKALSNLCKQGTIQRLSHSLYYKPEHTPLGLLPPSSQKIIEKVLSMYKNNIAYITGPSVYTRLGLTTQWTPEVIVATDINKRSPLRIGNLGISFCPSSYTGKNADTYILQWLDAVKNMRSISGTTPTKAALRLEQLLTEMNPKQLKRVARYAQSYPASTRAVVGMLLERVGYNSGSARLYKSFSRTSVFRIPLQSSTFPSLSRWNIR